MTPDDRRWSLLQAGQQFNGAEVPSLEARRQAAAMESQGYVQHDLDELSDGQRVLFLEGHDGGVAPGLYQRYGAIRDQHGARDEHVLVAYPQSPHSASMQAQDTFHGSEKGPTFSRVAYFVGSHPEHDQHYAQFYTARDMMHRAEAKE